MITTVFLGSSTVSGKGQAFDLIGELATRPANDAFKFSNFGVGGDLAYNVLQRLPEVVAAHPDKVVIIIGGNDIIASVFENVWRIFRITKHLPQRPSPEWFEANLRSIVRELKVRTSASIALASLPQVGEDPSSSNPAQAKLNDLYERYGAIIKRVAEEEHVDYVPLYEILREQIAASPGAAFTSFRFLPFYRDTLRFFLLRKTGDEIARLNGWRFHVDGVHLNSRGGTIAADAIQEFLSK
ncbi:MAG: hypothetical protein KGH79_01975 [Patescibacteria group bacterium]|nr:hypothetical protein [Patescibacteria group bacterium]